MSEDSSEYSSEQGTSDSEPSKGPRNPGWHVTVVTSAFTLGSVFAPYTLSAAGWALGTVFWIYSYLTTWWSGILLGRCVLYCESRGVGCTYPEMMKEAFGRPGYLFTSLMQIITYYTVVITILVNIANWLLLAQQIGDVQGWGLSPSLCLWQYLLITGAVTVGLAQIPTFRQVLPLAVVSLLSTLARQGILFHLVSSKDLMSECEPTYEGPTATSAFSSLATTAFLFGGHGMFPEEIREMRRPASFFNALHAAYAILGVVYVTGAYTGYAVWGSWTAGDNQMNWPLDTATLVSAILSVVWGLIEMTMAHVLMLDQVESLIGLERSASLQSQLLSFLLRTAFVCSEVFFAFMFSSAGIANIQGFVGAFGFTALTYTAPFAAYWQLILRKQSSSFWMQTCCALAFVSSLFLTVSGVYSSVLGVASDISTYRFFDTTRCSLAEVVQVRSCENPCLVAYGFNASTCLLGS